MNSYIKYIVSVCLAIIIPMNMLGNDGDIFTAKTIEGIEIKYKVIKEIDKTCQVGSGNKYEPAISKTYSGIITIPSSVNGYNVIGIGGYAFSYWGGQITSVIIPQTVKNIDDYAFEDCDKITSLDISNVTTIGSGAFFRCSNLSNIKLSNNLTSIGEQAFYQCNGLTSIAIPNTVKSLGARAFYQCKALSSITLSSSLQSIWEGTFEGCIKLGSIIIPNSVLNIGFLAFSGCTSLSSIVIPNSVKNLGTYSTFSGCTALKEISLSNSLTKIGEGTFFECSSLKSVVIPNSVKSLSKRAFANCSNLSDVKLPSSLLTIDDMAFQGCVNLSSITIPEKVELISNYAFTECSKLALVISEMTSPCTLGSYVFRGIASNATLQVPSGCKSAYQANSYWNYWFKNIIETGGISYSISITASGSGSASYNGYTTRNKTNTYSVSSGSSATITFIPDNGYRIKSVLVNSSNVTSYLSNNQYTISNISKNTTVEVTFEAIPTTTYTLSITASGNGSASYSGYTTRNKTNTYSVSSGSSATITFTPDNGYKIKSVLVNSSNVTSSVSNNQYTISNISKNTTVEVTFEAIPTTTYTLSITASGSGSASYNGYTTRNKTNSYTVNSGSNATITFTPDNGYKIKSVYVNNSDVTAYLSNNQYTISNITKNTTVSVTFEVNTFTLSITSTGSGYAYYNSTNIRSKTSSFTVNEGNSATIYFYPDNGYQIRSVKVNNSDVTSSVSNSKYTISNISRNTNVSVEFEEIPPTTYTLSITASGSGSASFDGTTIRSRTRSFTVNEGTSATITFTPDNGYRIKSVIVNNCVVTSSVSNNRYTISNIRKNTTLEVEFEEIPPTTYTLSITVSGNGSASYSGTTIRNKTTSFTLNEGTNVAIRLNPDNGYRVKSVKENNSMVTSFVSNNTFTINGLSRNTTIEVEFEEIPPEVFTLFIKAVGNGTATYNGTAVKNGTNTFNVTEGTTVTITLKPDNGYQIKSVKENNTNVTAYVADNTYTIRNVSRNTTVEVEFEEIPPTIYTLTITATGSGSVAYEGTTVRGRTSSFSVIEGTAATMSFTPDNGYRLKSLKVNNSNETAKVSGSSYTINNISGDVKAEVEFAEDIKAFESKDLNYTVTSYDNKTVTVSGGDFSQVLEVPANVTYGDMTWKVTGIESSVIANNPKLAAIIWHPETAFTLSVSNPNLLLYVTSANYAPASITNVVVNGTASRIILTDAANGNDFYCPQAFTAKSISYTHNYVMETGMGETRGWETIALPFDVQKITHASKGELMPFANWGSGNSKKPFWLMQLGTGGWSEASSIRANTPYIISMPNHTDYKTEFRLTGNVTFSAENVTVKKSDDLQTVSRGGNTFVPSFSNQQSGSYYALNVNNDFVTYSGGSAEGSQFVANLRAVRPFEAYMTSTSAARTIAVGEDMTTGIEEISALLDEGKGIRIYNLKGQLIRVEAGQSLEDIRKALPAGVYIIKGKKLIIK